MCIYILPNKATCVYQITYINKCMPEKLHLLNQLTNKTVLFASCVPVC